MQTTHMPHEHAFLAMHREFADLQGLPSGSPIYVTLTAQPLTSLLSGASAAARLPGGRVINTAELGGLTGRQVASKATTNRTCGSCLACLCADTCPAPMSPGSSWLGVSGQAGRLGIGARRTATGRTSADRGAPRSMGAALPARPSQRPCTGGGTSGSSAPASTGVSTRPEPSPCRRRRARQGAAGGSGRC